MTLGEKIVELKMARGIKTTEDLAEMASVPVGTINKILNGETKNPTGKTLASIAKALGTSVEYLYGKEEPQSIFNIPGILRIEKRRIPLLGTIKCGEPTFPGDGFSAYVEVGSDVRADFALRAKGDSMIGARIHDGDIVFVRRQDDVADGEIAAVILDDETTLKRVYKFPNGTAQLRSENPKYSPINIGGENETRVVRILGKVIAFQGDVL